MDEVKPLKPVILEGTVSRGFGRGGKLLGCPTANIPLEGNEKAVEDLGTGVYLGYALLRGNIYGVAASIGWNPHFKNDKKTIVRCKVATFYFTIPPLIFSHVHVTSLLMYTKGTSPAPRI
jgi:hypothetical protein